MLRRPLNIKSIADASRGTLVQFTMCKDESAGGSAELVSPMSTSQRYSQCGAFVRKSLSVRTQRSPECGLVLDRELKTAINILDKFLATLGQVPLEVLKRYVEGQGKSGA